MANKEGRRREKEEGGGRKQADKGRGGGGKRGERGEENERENKERDVMKERERENRKWKLKGVRKILMLMKEKKSTYEGRKGIGRK